MGKDYEEFMERSIAKSVDLVNEEMQVTIDVSMYPNKEDFITEASTVFQNVILAEDLKTFTI